MDFLVQRYVPWMNGPQFITEGLWEDIGVVRDLTADESAQACERATNGVAPLQPGRADRLRAIKWDAVSEHEALPGPPVIESATKEAPVARPAGSSPLPGLNVGGTL